jgi:hypothetical protein
MIEKMILEGYHTPELVDALNTNESTKKLVTEMCFKFGLKVFRPATDESQTFHLCHSNGFSVCKVWTEIETEPYTNATKTIYYYRSPYYRKDRGRSNADKETFFSAKIASLMTTLKRGAIVPTEEKVMRRQAHEWKRGISYLRDSHGVDNKERVLSPQQIHELLKFAIGGNTNLDILEICKNTLDKYNEADKILDIKNKDTERFFDNEFYCVGADMFNDLIVGSVKRVKPSEPTPEKYVYQVVKPFERVKEFDHDKYKDLSPILVMNKVAHEGKNFYGNYIPQTDGYDNSLDVINISDYVSDFNITWLLTPCSQS